MQYRLGLLFLGLILAGCSMPQSVDSIPEARYATLNLRIDVDLSQKSLPSHSELSTTCGLPEQVFIKASSSPTTVQAFGDTAQLHLNLLQTKALWQLSQGVDITVAVIDSGVDTHHQALQGALLPGYDFIQNTPEMQDESGHGTAVAALIAGRGPQWGLAPKAKILPLRVLDADNKGSSYTVSRAVLYAANLLPELPNPHKADLINLSLGGYGFNADLAEAIRQAYEAGLMIIAATGNEASAEIAFPAYLPEVIGVGAADLVQGRWQLTSYSNFGKGLCLLAPLGGLSDTNWGRYAESGLLTAEFQTQTQGTRVHGTSYATALVSGLAALMLAERKDPMITTKYLLTSASNVMTAGWNEQSGFGVIDPLAALSALRGEQTAPIVVQLLDAGSQQEMTRGYTIQNTSFILEPGKYQIQAWYDLNQDAVWQVDEPFYRSSSATNLQLDRGDTQNLNLYLMAK